MSFFLAATQSSTIDLNETAASAAAAAATTTSKIAAVTNATNATNHNHQENISSDVFTTSISINGEHAVAAISTIDFTILCIKGLIFGTIIISAVLGNALVIISVHKNRKLR